MDSGDNGGNGGIPMTPQGGGMGMGGARRENMGPPAPLTADRTQQSSLSFTPSSTPTMFSSRDVSPPVPAVARRQSSGFG